MREPKIHGNLLSIILQRAYLNGGESEVIKVAKESVEGLTADQIIMIAKGKARLDGTTETGLKYVKEKKK